MGGWTPSSSHLAPGVGSLSLACCVRADVVDAVIEVSAGPSDAVSALAGMSPASATAVGDEAPAASAEGAIASSAVRTTSNSENSEATAAAATNTSSATVPLGNAYGGSKRHAMTLGAMQAQKASDMSGSGDEGSARAEAQEGVVEGGGGGGASAGRDNSELEKVSAFISSYAGTLSCLPVPFVLPRRVVPFFVQAVGFRATGALYIVLCTVQYPIPLKKLSLCSRLKLECGAGCVLHYSNFSLNTCFFCMFRAKAEPKSTLF